MLLNSEEIRTVVNDCVYKAKKEGRNDNEIRFIFIELLYKKLKSELDCYSDLYSLLG